MKQFVHLHNHSHFSLLDSSAKIPDLVKRVKELEFPAIALTDHGNMSGAVQLWNLCKKEKIKPIIGCELYVSVGDHLTKIRQKGVRNYHHLIVLAMNQIGYQNLCKLVSEGYINGFYYKPRVSMEFLAKHSEGLFCTTACMASPVAQALLPRNNPDEANAILQAKRVVDNLHGIFGDNLRLELQDHGIPEQRDINIRMLKLSVQTGIKTVFTNDTHFLKEDDFEAHRALKCIGSTDTVNTIIHVYKPDHRLKSAEEMYAIAERYPTADRKLLVEAMEESVRVADQIDFSFTTKEVFPEVSSGNSTPHEEFRRLCFEGFENRSLGFIKDKGTEYSQRLMYEMELISRMGYESYFLIIADLVNYAKENDIPVGPGRGSAAGSLVAYCLGITNLDPIRHGLLFERFLNPARISMPDIDMDFSKRHRSKLIDYTIAKYGADRVAQIITFATLKPRAALKDMGRVHNWTVSEQNALANLVPQTPNKPYTLSKAEEELQDVQRALRDPKNRQLWDLAVKLEDVNRQASIHAAGIVITPEPLANYVPLFKNTGEKSEVAAGYDMRDLEKIGLIKMDYLGLKTLDHIADCIKLTGKDIDIDNIPLDDPEVIKIFANGDTKGVFQFESPGMRKALRALKPTTFDDIVAMNALYRPGPMDSGMMDSFIKRKNGREKVEAFHPDLEEILKPTYGVLVFQEQVMETVRKLAGFSLGEADVMRKAMGKKDPVLMQQELDKFVEAGIKMGYSEQEIREVGEAIRKFARYGFNRAHAAAYSWISYQTAWLKRYYPIEFMCSILIQETEDKKPEKVREYIGDAHKMGIDILAPDVNYSDINFTIERGNGKRGKAKIRYGLASIIKVGDVVAHTIVDMARARPFRSFIDFLDRTGLNRGVVENLIKAGATGSLGGSLELHLENIGNLLDRKKKSKKDANQISFLDETGDTDLVAEFDMKPAEPWAPEAYSKAEKEALGIWLVHHPLKPHINFIKDDLITMKSSPPKKGWKILAVITGIEYKSTKKDGTQFAIVEVEDLSGTSNLIVYGKEKIDKWQEHLTIDNIVWLKGSTTQDKKDPDQVRFNLYEIESINNPVMPDSENNNEEGSTDISTGYGGDERVQFDNESEGYDYSSISI